MSSPALPDNNNYTDSETLVIRLNFDYDSGVAKAEFWNGQDDQTVLDDERVVGFLDLAAASLGYLLVPDDSADQN